MLDLFDELELRACFFLLGHVCERYPAEMAQIARRGHEIGAHGYVHERLFFKGVRWQRQHIARATAAIRAATGQKPEVFRAPRFSATARTIRVLEEAGYKVDSSILPGSTAMIAGGRIPIRSTMGAPRVPYHPSRRDILVPGDSPVWEVPVTESPIFPGAPVTMGGLNTFGVDRMREALRALRGDAIFLIHPWECVDLGGRYPHLKDWVKKLCAPNRGGLREFLSTARDIFDFSTYDGLLHPSGDNPG